MERPAKRFYEFDRFRIDIEERRLLHADLPVQLTPKVFDILLTLVENNGHTVEKEKLMESVWADTFVEEGNLNRNVSTLRKVLGEDGHEPHFIKTVPKRGYRFEGNVHEIVVDDEAIQVERRTKYTLALREHLEAASTDAGLRGRRRLSIAGTAFGILLVLAFAWASVRTPTSDANSFSSGRAPRGTNDAVAFELYQKARMLWQNRSVDGLHQATQDLEQAILRDPQFTAAHAALADAYAFDVGNWTKAEATANEAIRLDPSLGQPYATIGFVRTFWEWRLSEAEPYFKRAIALSPDYATAHQWYAINLTVRNQGGSGLAEIRRALELEPASLSINGDLCQILYFSLKYDQAIDQCQKTVRMDPNFLPAHQYLNAIYTEKRMYPEAIEEYFEAEELNMTAQTPHAQLDKLRKAYAGGGIRAFWQERVRALSAMERPPAYPLAQYHALLGNVDEARFWFKRSAEARDFDFIYFTSDPINRDVAADPRSEDLVNRLHN